MLLDRLVGLTVKDDDHNSRKIKVDVFLQFLRDNKTETERAAKPNTPKRSNFLREVKKELNGEYVPFSCVLQYIFNHSSDLYVLAELSKNACSRCISKAPKNDGDGTCFQLYEKLISQDFACFKGNYENLEEGCLTLQTCYKTYFQDVQQWENICLFETEFQKSTYFHLSDNILKQTERKWEFFEYVKSLRKTSTDWQVACKSLIKIQKQRHAAAKIASSVKLFAKYPHRPDVLDECVSELLEQDFPNLVSRIAVVHHKKSQSENSFDVYVESNQENEIISRDCGDAINNMLASMHQVCIRKVYIFENGSLSPYYDGCTLRKRFQLRDDCILGKLNLKKVAELDMVCSMDEKASHECHECFPPDLPAPLRIDSFDVVKEWSSLPLVSRLLLSTFLNKRSMSNTNQTSQAKYLKDKISQLYFANDILLNTYNMLHIGVMQEALSKDLLLYHQNVHHLFDITSRIGVTSSRTSVGGMIGEEADGDRVYYRVYLKGHDLPYNTVQGPSEHCVSLRQCHIVVMLDNLVRLVFKTDPVPGESRSGQKCLLPITLQGLPKDSLEASLWHDPETCNGDNLNCLCKMPTRVSASEVEDKIMNLMPEEKSAWVKFSRLITWGNPDIWHLLHTDSKLVDLVNTAVQHGSDEEEHRGTDETLIIPLADDESEECQFDLERLIKEHKQSAPSEESLSDSESVLDDEELAAELDVTPIDKISMAGLSTSLAELDLQQTELTSKAEIISLLQSFDIEKYAIGALLTLHPPPAVGRDDDLEKLHEILEDILLKTGQLEENLDDPSRLIVGVDHKIGKNLLCLIKRDQIFKKFLPEFPPLHLRKSKINTFFSAYKDTGIFQILIYQRDDGILDWARLSDSTHIDAATRTIRRIGLGLQLAFTVKFIETLPPAESKEILKSLKSDSSISLSEMWQERYAKFVEDSSCANGTFALHKEWLDHCNEITAVALAERMGGPEGYHLLLAAVKHSLPFSFLNGAGSYAPYTVDLLFEHFDAGFFHQNMKKALFSTPIYDSTKNFGSDSKREMGHKYALKAFTPTSQVSTIQTRLSRFDEQLSLHESVFRAPNTSSSSDVLDCLGWDINQTDLLYSFRVAGLVLKCRALQCCADDNVYNMYTPTKTLLPNSVLDKNTVEIGKYLARKYIFKEKKVPGYCAPTPPEAPSQSSSQLAKRASKTAGNTLKRTSRGAGGKEKSKEDIENTIQQQKMKRNMEVAKCLSSELNTCQALVQPGGEKRAKQKSVYVAQALQKIIKEVSAKDDQQPESLFYSCPSNTSSNFTQDNISCAIIEFAGMKFKTSSSSGKDYLKSAEQFTLKPILRLLPKISEIVICEEKYLFTPDIFKGNTRQARQRAQPKQVSVAHLRSTDEIISTDRFDAEAVRKTALGKSLIGTYLAENITKLDLDGRKVNLTVDSELHIENCSCGSEETCRCGGTYSVPVKCVFGPNGVERGPLQLPAIHQRKGEAEMAQCDWVWHFLPPPGQAVASFVTSGDIDTVLIHLFMLGKLWRDTEFCDRPTVYVILQKPQKKWDVYNITLILNALERAFGDSMVGPKIATVLCIGGNDFLPGFSGISHMKVLNLFKDTDLYLNSLLLGTNKLTLSSELFVDFVKDLYIKGKGHLNDSFEQVRQSTIHKKQSKKLIAEQGVLVNHPRSWLPPRSALVRLADLVQYQIEYLETAGFHDAPLPSFHLCRCLDIVNGQVKFNFGPESHVSTLEELAPNVTDRAAMDMAKTKVVTPKKKKSAGSKRSLKYTPQKGGNRKKILTSTPK